jgi:hypothetical protein
MLGSTDFMLSTISTSCFSDSPTLPGVLRVYRVPIPGRCRPLGLLEMSKCIDAGQDIVILEAAVPFLIKLLLRVLRTHAEVDYMTEDSRQVALRTS